MFLHQVGAFRKGRTLKGKKQPALIKEVTFVPSNFLIPNLM